MEKARGTEPDLRPPRAKRDPLVITLMIIGALAGIVGAGATVWILHYVHESTEITEKQEKRQEQTIAATQAGYAASGNQNSY